LWAGQGTRGLTSGQTAADIVAETIREALLICPFRESDHLK
jgi:nitronate monooxygenase